jgi:hypothetical protein
LLYNKSANFCFEKCVFLKLQLTKRGNGEMAKVFCSHNSLRIMNCAFGVCMQKEKVFFSLLKNYAHAFNDFSIVVCQKYNSCKSAPVVIISHSAHSRPIASFHETKLKTHSCTIRMVELYKWEWMDKKKVVFFYRKNVYICKCQDEFFTLALQLLLFLFLPFPQL